MSSRKTVSHKVIVKTAFIKNAFKISYLVACVSNAVILDNQMSAAYMVNIIKKTFLPVLLLLTIIISAGQIEAKKKRTFRLDFRDQEIQEVLKAMSGILGKNIIADEKVRGKITIISPKRIPASQVYSYLKTILSVKGFGMVYEGNNLIKVVTMKDAVARSPVVALGREPIPTDKEKQQAAITHIMPLENTKPSRMAAILKRITSPSNELVDFDEVNMLILTGDRPEINRLVRIAAMLDVEIAGEEVEETGSGSFGNVHIYRLENMQAENIEATLRKLSIPVGEDGKPIKKGNQTARPKEQKLDVVAHKESNSIIYVGTQAEFNLVKGLIRRIDLPRDQVLLEVLIVEVEADDQNSFGIDWRIDDGTAQFNSGLAAEGNVVDTTDGDITGVNTLLGFSLGVIREGGETVLGILNANLKRDNFAVISAPQVLTLDNQEAEINVGEDVPVRTNTRITDNGNQFDSFDYRPTGVKLKFTPQINKNRMITLNLYQEVKAISGATQDANANPKFTTRDIKTVVRVKDRQTIVIGGLVSTNKTKNVRKIPILGDIPILGYLFKRTSAVMRRTNLLVFITPHILTSRTVADKITDDAIEEQQKEFRQYDRNN